MARIFTISFLSMVLLSDADSMIMRNNALMSKMISKFQDKEEYRSPPRSPPRSTPPPPLSLDQNKLRVVSLMQNILCKNFPSVPCEYITNDLTLRRLIETSIQQLKNKKKTLEKAPVTPGYHHLTLFPVVNSEDLSDFLQVSDTGFFKKKPKPRKKPPKKSAGSAKNYWSHERSKTSVINGRKKMRKFYPHKIKYKDKNEKRDHAEYSEERLSMSVEVPGEHVPAAPLTQKRFPYRGDAADPPVWRIDYMKHGEPTLNMFGYQSDSLKGKIIKAGPNVIVDDHFMDQAARKDVLHPDVYIKKNYLKKKNLDANSEYD